MAISDIPMIQMLSRKQDWLIERQTVIGQNIANANTPRYRARDLESFASPFSHHMHLSLVRTRAAHMAGIREARTFDVKEDRDPSAAKPSGNTVNLDKELARMHKTGEEYQVMLSLKRVYGQMYKTSINTQGS